MNPRLELACTRIVIAAILIYSGYRLLSYFLV